MTSQAQLRRLLSLVPYLREHDGVAMTEVAATFGITLQTLREDLSVLWMCGLPGLTPGDLIDIDMDAVDGEGVIHLSNADYLTRPLRLSADEALALVLALRTLREITGPGDREAVDRALKKLEAAAGNVVATDQASVAVTAGRDDVQARVNDALQRGKRLDLTYDVASRAETTRRMVDPLRVFVLEGYGYLEAWCYSAGALRTFRLDRIAAVEVTETDVEPHHGRAAEGSVHRLVRGPAGLAAGHPRAPAVGGLGGGVLPDRVGDPARGRPADGVVAGHRPRVAAGAAAPAGRRRLRRLAARRGKLGGRGRAGGAGPVRRPRLPDECQRESSP